MAILNNPAAAGPAFFETQTLFESTSDHQVRIPKIVVTTGGAVLAFADSGHTLRRSTDGGRTWRPAQPVAERSGNALVDAETGDVLVVCPRQGLLYRSRDQGATWQPEAITLRPNALGHGTPDGVPADAAASESGLTLHHGEHRGRLLMPVRIQPPEGSNAQEYWAYNYNTAIYSDDRGQTWQVSDPVQSGTGEGTLAELTDGRITYNSRCHMAVDHRRRIAWSHDGGHRWVDWQVAEDLFEVGEPFYFKYGSRPSYGCNAGLVRIPSEATGGEDVLLFSTLDNPGSTRVRMTIWASFDGAATWPVKRLVHGGSSAYSSLAAGPDGALYLLFENGDAGPYERISVARFNLAWLLDDG
jgi:sialidase-1